MFSGQGRRCGVWAGRGRGAAADSGGGLAGVAFEHGRWRGGRPRLRRRVGFVEERLGGRPRVLRNVHEVVEDVDVDAATVGTASAALTCGTDVS